MVFLRWLPFILAFLLMACRPNLPEGPAQNLVFDSNYSQNLVKLQKLTNAEGVRIFWWNVAWGSFNGEGFLNRNLINLINSSSRPDLLILGEYKDGILSQETIDTLNRNYPHRDFVPYTPSDIVGVVTYSLVPFKKEVQRTLDWSPPDEIKSVRDQYKANWMDSAHDEAKYWDRAYVLYSTTLNGQKYYFSPVHLLEPWKALHDGSGDRATLYNLFFGGDNPLEYQAQRYKSFLNYDTGGSNGNDPVVAIGDFNAPKEIFFLTPKIYSQLAKGMTEAFFGNPNTFPSKYAERISNKSLMPISVKIDHVLFNNKVERVGGAALEMAGSDHYPIYVVLKPKSGSWWPF